MDKYGQIGPEKGDYASDVVQVADALAEFPVFVKLADRMTQYRLMLVRCDAPLWFCGDGGEAGFGVAMPSPEWLFVACMEHGSWVFEVGSYMSPDYVAGKLGLKGVVCGEIVGEFLMRLSSVLRPVTT